LKVAHGDDSGRNEYVIQYTEHGKQTIVDVCSTEVVFHKGKVVFIVPDHPEIKNIEFSNGYPMSQDHEEPTFDYHSKKPVASTPFSPQGVKLQRQLSEDDERAKQSALKARKQADHMRLEWETAEVR